MIALAASGGTNAGQVILGFVVIIFAVGAYFTPLILAWVRHLDNIMQIALLNFFLGWTMIGWVIALIWAAKPMQRQVT
jgi:hypothetical protein